MKEIYPVTGIRLGVAAAAIKYPDRNDLLVYSQDNGIAEIMIPKTIHVVDQVPVLGRNCLVVIGDPCGFAGNGYFSREHRKRLATTPSAGRARP